MQNTESIRKGDIYYCDFGNNEGSVQGGIRPAIVLQDDNYNACSPVIIVAPLTTVCKKTYMASHIEVGTKYGLEKPSMILMEQLKTVNKTDLQNFVGNVYDRKTADIITTEIKRVFGIKNENYHRFFDVRCLCRNCLEDYINNPNYIVKRFDPLKREKEKCDKCNGRGYDYSIFDKRRVLGGRKYGK